MLKIMIDTNIHDKIEADKELKLKIEKLIKEAVIILLTTHVQQDELPEHLRGDFVQKEITTNGFVLGVSRQDHAKLGDGTQSSKINSSVVKIPTAGAIWGISKWGEAKYGDGSNSGISLDDIRGSSFKSHSKDSLIATTASANADIFVSEDKRLLKKMKNLPVGCKILNFEEFKESIEQEKWT